MFHILARREEKGKIQLVKKAMNPFLRYSVTALAIAASPKKAADNWLDKVFAEKDVNERRRKIETEWVCKHVLVHPVSSPTTIVWGHGEKIVWKEALYGDVFVRHPVHHYLAPIAIDNNVGFPLIFDSRDELQNYINTEFEYGKIREGSFRLTFKGTSELGEMIFQALLDHISEGQHDPLFIPPDFRNLVLPALENFQFFIQQRRLWNSRIDVAPSKLESLLAKYPFEFGLTSFVIDYLYFMGRLAVISEY
jgi:hypothetical protein